MKKNIILFLLLCFGLFAQGGKKETFLNLSAGMTLGEITKIVGEKNISKIEQKDTYKIIREVTDGNLFDELRVIITKKYGLVRITAYTETKDTNVYGDNIKDDFKNLYNALSKKYGEGIKYDFLRKGSIWNEPEDYTMGLLKEERHLAAFWTKDDGLKSEDLIGISLQILMLNNESYFIGLTYELRNLKEYIAEEKVLSEAKLDL